MVIPHDTAIALRAKGINTVGDSIGFDDTKLTQISLNLRRPGGGVVPIVFGEKSQQSLQTASNLVQYYGTAGRSLTAPNIQWNWVMQTPRSSSRISRKRCFLVIPMSP